MGPIFEDRLVDALRLDEMPALISRDAAEEDVVMRPLDDVDGIDLDVAEPVLDRKSVV